MPILSVTHRLEPLELSIVLGLFSRGAYQEACPVALRMATCGHLERERAHREPLPQEVTIAGTALLPAVR